MGWSLNILCGGQYRISRDKIKSLGIRSQERTSYGGLLGRFHAPSKIHKSPTPLTILKVQTDQNWQGSSIPSHQSARLSPSQESYGESFCGRIRSWRPKCVCGGETFQVSIRWREVVHDWRLPVIKRTASKFPIPEALNRVFRCDCRKKFRRKWAKFCQFPHNIMRIRQNPVVTPTPTTPTTRGKRPILIWKPSIFYRA